MASEVWDRQSASRALAELAALDVRGPDEGEIEDAARWLSASLAPRATPTAPAGLVRQLSVIGPFEDTGGKLSAPEGPELDSAWHDASWDRGPIQVRARHVPPDAVQARGVPLDLMIHPRQESCTYLGSHLSLPGPRQFIVRIASSGSLRAIWNGRDVAEQQDVYEGATFDRVAFRVRATAGDHVLLLKVCSGPLADEGSVRVRATDDRGRGVELPWSPLLRGVETLATAQIAPRQTLLQRVLATGPHPSTTRALDAAIVRRFGGAEDLRSPRVPGLLDSVVRDARAPSSTLALAAWVTPFGAERSGRLQLARDRAEAVGDSGTVDFTLRRLAEQRLDSGFTDWATAALRTAPTATATDAEARMLRARVLSESSIMRAASLAQLVAIAVDFPDVPAVWEAIARAARGADPQAHSRAQARLWQLSPHADCAALVLAKAVREPDAAARDARDCAIRTPADAQEVVAVGRTLMDLGRYEDAHAVFLAASPWLVNASAFWAGMAGSCQSTVSARATDCALGALRRGVELQPTDLRLSHRLALAAPNRSGVAEEVDLVDPSVFLARKNASPARAGTHKERQLYWLREVDYLDDGRVAQTLHYAREVVLAPRTPHDLEEELPVDDANLEILRARVHRAAGGKAFAEEQESDGARSRIRWPELRPGDVVEVALRTITSGPVGRRGDPPFYFVDYVGGTETSPLLYGEIVVQHPVDKPLAIDVLHGEPQRREDETRSGRRRLRMIWDQPMTVAEEPLAPEPSEIVPTVIGSTYASWKDFLEWYRTAVQGFSEPDEQVRALAAELTAGLTTREQKLGKLFEFVADEIRYVNFVSAEEWLPNRPQQVLARKQGDCDDKALLLIALLRAVGIEATEVLLQSRYTGQPSVLRSTKAAVPLFDHGIAWIPGQSGAPGTWLDPTNPQNRLGPVPSLDARGLAVFVHGGTDLPIATPQGVPADHGVQSDWEIRLDADGGGGIVASEDHAGDSGQQLRGALAEPDARADWVEKNLLLGWFGSLRVGSSVEFLPDVGLGTAKVKYEARSSSIARREGRDLIVQVAPGDTLTGALATLARRTLHVALPPEAAPGHERRRIRIISPPGYAVQDLPPGGEEDGGAFGTASLVLARDTAEPGTVVVTRTVVLDQSDIPPERYQAWRSWLQRVDALMQRSIRFVAQDDQARDP